MDKKHKEKTSSLLESIYKEYHIFDYIHPDPLEFLFMYNNKADREIAGLIASSLATGRVSSILKSVESILEKLPSLQKNLKEMDRNDLENIFKDFRYRFYNSESLIDLLIGIKNVINEFGSLNNCFLSFMKKNDKTIIPSLTAFAEKLTENNLSAAAIIPSPSKGSACKRLNLYLRWMVRNDIIDPGGWEGVSPALLIVPIDTHMLKISHILKLTERKSADMKTAIEITDSFKIFDSEDPVRFDFSLTRLGIHPLLDYSLLKF